MNNFEKEAQRKSVTKAIGRAINPMEWVRQLSSQKYRSLINAVDYIDGQMRKRVLDLKPSLRDQLHQARMAMKNHEYGRVFQYATSILNSVDGVFIEKITDLDELGRRVYNDFSKNNMSEEERRQLEEDLFREPIREKSSEFNPELFIEAGVTQWLQEKMPTKRELEGNLFNKLFNNMNRKQQEAAREALGIAEKTYNLITEAFERLDNERRNIMEYIRLAREYHKNLMLEKSKLKRMYINYFPVETPPQEQTSQQTPQITVTQTPAQNIPLQQNQTELTNAPVEIPNLENPNKESTANDLVHRAKIAIFNGDIGIGVALLVKASEICDEYGDEQRSISLLKSAYNIGK